MDLEHEQRLTAVEEKSKRNEGRIKKLESEHEALNKLTTSVALMAERQDTMNTNVEKLTEKVDNIEAKPGKRWESMEEKVLVTIIGGLVGFILAQLGVG